MGAYEDIIRLQRPASRRAPMSRTDRAAQFSPFAALTGYDAVIAETGRLTDSCTELDESRMAEINEVLQKILESADTMPQVALTWFREDDHKSGGAYLRISGRVKKLDLCQGKLLLEDGTAVDIVQLRDIELM